MNRRNVLALTAAVLLGYATLGRGPRPRFAEVKTMPITDWPKRIAEQAQTHLPQYRIAGDKQVRFDPATLALVAQLVWGLLRYCMAAQIRRQHVSLARNPSGAVEQRMRSKLTRQFIEQHPDADAVEVDHQVRATLAAFAIATHHEIEELIADAQDRNAVEPLDWDTMRRAAQLTEIAE